MIKCPVCESTNVAVFSDDNETTVTREMKERWLSVLNK